MEWSMEKTMEFLDLYEVENLIWDPKNPYQIDRNFVHDSWKRIQSKRTFECSIKILKIKKTIF